MSSAADALCKRPRGVTVREPDFAGGALAAGAACTQYRGLLYSDFQRFNILFSSEVENRVDKVSLIWFNNNCFTDGKLIQISLLVDFQSPYSTYT